MDKRLTELREVFVGRLLTDAADMAPFLVDWRREWRGSALAVVQPSTTAEVAAVVRWCAKSRTPIVPQGGNTGLAGGATPDESGHSIVLSLARLDGVRALDRANNTITVEAGCTLQRVQEAAAGADRLFPLSLAAEGSCTIGGNLSTNAGGTSVLRYGNARDLCLGLEVVTPQGEVWNGLRGLRKDNTGYDLRGLFIGSEGSLGVITAAVLKLFPTPLGKIAALVAAPSVQDAVALLERAHKRLGASLAAFELMSDIAIEMAVRHFPRLRAPAMAPTPWRVLIEAHDLQDSLSASTALESFLAEAHEAGEATDAVIATSHAQSAALWALREHLSEAQGLEGKSFKHNVSVPISRVPAFIVEAETAIKRAHAALRPYVFGHLGDGNIHFNISPPAGDARDLSELKCEVNALIHDIVVKHNGSISAEHGLGTLRRDEAARYKSPIELALMRAIKHAIDPLGLMNPGKVLAKRAAFLRINFNGARRDSHSRACGKARRR